MAGSSLFALIDDIASILDDVAAMSKIAAKKTAGVLGDDLALNAQQVAGVSADRELPIVWAVAVGSAVNKLILVPAALAISALLPWAVMPLLMLGGAYLCYEGFEKLAHRMLHGKESTHPVNWQSDAPFDPVAMEKDKIKGAIRTDFVLSAEIIVITLGTVADATLGKQFAVLSAIAVLMTVGVYGLVAAIVKFDDAGLYLSGRSAWLLRGLGAAILRAAPLLMKTLSVVGTAAMFVVGGGILTHGIPVASVWLHEISKVAGSFPVGGMIAEVTAPLFLNLLAGMLTGALVLALVSVAGRVRRLISG
jgi:predicted DNA repair protein MutK